MALCLPENCNKFNATSIRLIIHIHYHSYSYSPDSYCWCDTSLKDSSQTWPRVPLVLGHLQVLYRKGDSMRKRWLRGEEHGQLISAASFSFIHSASVGRSSDHKTHTACTPDGSLARPRGPWLPWWPFSMSLGRGRARLPTEAPLPETHRSTRLTENAPEGRQQVLRRDCRSNLSLLEESLGQRLSCKLHWPRVGRAYRFIDKALILHGFWMVAGQALAILYCHSYKLPADGAFRRNFWALLESFEIHSRNSPAT